jgi:hypothetical protein
VVFSALRCSLGQAGSRFEALQFDGPVDRQAAHTEQLGDLEGAVLAAVYQGDQVRFLLPVELGLLAAQPDQIRLDYVDRLGLVNGPRRLLRMLGTVRASCLFDCKQDGLSKRDVLDGAFDGKLAGPPVR